MGMALGHKINARLEELKARIAEAEAQLRAALERIKELEAKRGPGRPKKDE